MNKYSTLFPAVVLLSACGANIDDLVAYTEKVKQTTTVTIDAYPEFKKLDPVSYEATNLRSPFKRSLNTETVEKVVSSPKCNQPNLGRKKQALESYGIDAMQMSGVFTTNGKRFALISANDGSLHKASIGTYIGLFHGRIVSITNSEIQIKEMLPDGGGCWKEKIATMSMSTVIGDDNNV